MIRKATYKLGVTRREALYVHDEPDHSLMMVEMEGEPIHYEVGVAGEFVSRRSVNFHDRIKGSGSMQGYAVTNFQYGSVFSRFEGHRDGESKVTTGTWKTYKGTGKLADIKGEGSFKVTQGSVSREFVLEMEGNYEL
ncbi:MAG: hypothetical protein JRI75_00535 [Deltaproteobacteria bacterium]|nr:hypothetical protein [Deltaproteobacteria bacterium]